MIINLNKNQGYQLCEEQEARVVIDITNGAVISRIAVDVSSGQKTLLSQTIADESVILFDGRTLRRIQQNLSIE